MRQHLLFVFLIFLVLWLTGCQRVEFSNPYRAVDGLIDLSSWQWRQHKTINLEGEWAFYPQRFVSPQDLASSPVIEGIENVYVPGAWQWRETADGQPASGHGHGTYVLRVLLPEDSPELALKLIDICTAYNLYVDGELLHAVGKVGESETTSEPGFLRGLVILPANPENEHLIVLHVSNYHYRIGGLSKHLVLGTTQDVVDLNDLILGYDIFLAASIGMIGLYHLGLFSMNRRDPSPLFFALFCLAIVFRLLSTDERYITQLLPTITYNNMLRMEYASFLLATPAFAAFIQRLVPDYSPPWMVNGVIGAGIIFALGVLSSTPQTFSEWLPVFQVYLVMSCGFCFYILVTAVVQRRETARGFFFGFLILALAVVNDILVSIGVLHTPVYLAGAGFFCFVLIQSYALSLRSAQALKSIERLTGELEVHSADLERKVEERTQALAQANLELERLAVIDGLTQIANRRQFDEAFEREWTSHRRRRATLSVILCDIDFFKPYNDNYGHVKGDNALRAVAAAIQHAVSRPNDTVARYGGEEFAILLPDTEMTGAVEVAERIRSAVSDLEIEHKASDTGELSLSLGVASAIPSEEVSKSALLEMADEALYDAKGAGRNCVRHA